MTSRSSRFSRFVTAGYTISALDEPSQEAFAVLVEANDESSVVAGAWAFIP